MTFFDFGLICDQQLSTSCQRSWRDVAYSEEIRRGIMKLKGSEAKLNPSRAPCYWCLSEIAYYLQEINTGDFKCSQTKAILSCSFVHGGSSPSRTFHNIFIHQDLLVFLVSKIESVTTKHGKDRKYCQRSEATQKLMIEHLTWNRETIAEIWSYGCGEYGTWE